MKKKELFFYLLFLFTLTVSIIFIQLNKLEPFESFSLTFNDINFNLQEKEPNKNIVFVAIDEPSVNQYGRWPWKREKLAEGIKKLNLASIVLVDMIFSEATTPKEDAVLVDSINSLNSSVCGFFLRANATQTINENELNILSNSSLDMLQSQISEFNAPKFVSAPFAEVSIAPILNACTLSGSFSTLRRGDGKLRDYPLAMYFSNVLYPSLGVQALRVTLNKDITRLDDTHLRFNDTKIALESNGFVRLNYYKLKKYKTVSFLDVAKGIIKPEYFKDKIVILGITEVGVGDIVTTPIGTIPGALLHYTFISNILEHHLIQEKNAISIALIIFMSFLPLLLVLLIVKVTYRLVLNLLIYGLVYTYVRYLFVVDMYYIDLFYPLIALVFALIIVESITFNFQEKKSKFIRSAFSSYLSEELLDQLIKNPDTLSLGGESKELTILFSDIRGFTTLSESMKPEDLVQLLNRYFTPMTETILESKGMLDKYIGDAIMAFFNAPIDVKNHADAACLSALTMLERLELLNKELKDEGITPISLGIGINTADVVVGNMGSNTRFNYTLIGDGVNLTSRVESLTKNYSVDILITEFTVKQLSDKFIYRKIEYVRVKGKNEAVLLYELLPLTKKSKEMKKLYDLALEAYILRDYENADLQFSYLVQKYDDKLSSYFLNAVRKKELWQVQSMDKK